MSGYLFLRTYSWSCRHHPVRKHVEIQTHQLEDVFKKADDLKSQHVLGRETKVTPNTTVRTMVTL